MQSRSSKTGTDNNNTIGDNTMNGSAKQIEWATSIKANMMAEIERLRGLFNSPDTFDRYVRLHSKNADAETVASSKREFTIGLAILAAAEMAINDTIEAGWFIDNRKASVISSLHRKAIRQIEAEFNCDAHIVWMALGSCR